MFKLLSGILSKNDDRKDRSLVRGRSARHPWSLVRMLGRYDAATTTVDNVRHWAAADGLSASAASVVADDVGTNYLGKVVNDAAATDSFVRVRLSQ